MDTTALINQLIQQINSPATQTQYQTSSPQAGLQSFFNTPMYQLLYGNNAANLASNGQYSPVAAFQADPGFAYNQQQTANQLQKYSAAKGLLESSGMQNQLATTLQGNQNQMYQQWLGQQNQLYNSYQGQLANLANLGSQNTGASQATNSGNLLGQLLGSYNVAAGQNLGQANLSTGADIASLLANQGFFGANAYLNTGSALAGTAMNTYGMQQQQNNLQTGINTASGYNSGGSNTMGSFF